MEWRFDHQVTGDGNPHWSAAVQKRREYKTNKLLECEVSRKSIVHVVQAFENAEDLRGRENVEIKKDEDVERVRRAHLNDLENIPAFILSGFFYVLTGPNVDLALWLFRIAVLARIGHTIVSSNLFVKI